MDGRAGQGEEWGVVNGFGVSLWSDESVPEFAVMAAHPSTCTKKCWIVYYKMVDFMV